MKNFSLPSVFALGLCCGYFAGSIHGSAKAEAYPCLGVLFFIFFLSALFLVIYERNGNSAILVFSISLMMGLGTEIRAVREDLRRYWGMELQCITEIGGILVDDPARGKGAYNFFLDVDEVRDKRDNSASARQRVYVRFKERPDVFRGDRIRFRCTLGRGRDGRFFADAKNISSLFREGRSTTGNLRIKAFSGLQKAFRKEASSPFGLLEALVLGNREKITLSLKDAFLKAGAVHILALSGMHVGILVLCVLSLSRPLCGISGSRILSAIFVVAYLFLVGPRASIVRAVLMYLLYLTVQTGGRRVSASVILSLTFAAVIGIDPTSLRDAGFVLSYSAMAGILRLTTPLRRLLRPVFPEPVLTPLAVSLGAQIATLPAMAVFFGTAYPAGIVSSLFLGPLITLFMWSGLATLFLSPLGINFLLEGLHRLLDFLYTLIEMTVYLFSGFPACDFSNIFVFFPAYGAFCLLLLFPRTRPKPGRSFVDSL